MHAEKHYLIVAFQRDGKKSESIQRKVFLNMKCYKNTPGFTWANTPLKFLPTLYLQPHPNVQMSEYKNVRP